MDIRQCPRCELRFEHEAELKSHLVIDHNLDPEAFDDDYPGRGDADAAVETGDPAVAEVVEAGADESSTGAQATTPATDTGR